LNADVEIENPDHVIATIDDDKTTFGMEIVVETGRGYRALDETGSGRKVSDMIMLRHIIYTCNPSSLQGRKHPRRSNYRP
jgi:DNA-directed RNA polymerase alpha subunit